MWHSSWSVGVCVASLWFVWLKMCFLPLSCMSYCICHGCCMAFCFNLHCYSLISPMYMTSSVNFSTLHTLLTLQHMKDCCLLDPSFMGLFYAYIFVLRLFFNFVCFFLWLEKFSLCFFGVLISCINLCLSDITEICKPKLSCWQDCFLHENNFG